MNSELVKQLEQIENERKQSTMFQKRLTMEDLTKVAFELEPSNPKEDVADIATAIMQEMKYSESLRKKMITQFTTMFKLKPESSNYLLKGEIRDEINIICERMKLDNEYLAICYLYLMMMSYKNFAELVAALAQFKRSNSVFTLKIFVQYLPKAAKSKSPATTYEICAQFLMQMEQFGFLTKVAQIYKVKDVKLNDDFQSYARDVISRLPVELEEDLYEVLGIEILPKPAPEAIQD